MIEIDYGASWESYCNARDAEFERVRSATGCSNCYCVHVKRTGELAMFCINKEVMDFVEDEDNVDCEYFDPISYDIS